MCWLRGKLREGAPHEARTGRGVGESSSLERLRLIQKVLHKESLDSQLQVHQVQKEVGRMSAFEKLRVILSSLVQGAYGGSPEKQHLYRRERWTP